MAVFFTEIRSGFPWKLHTFLSIYNITITYLLNIYVDSHMANIIVACLTGDATDHPCLLYNSFSWVSRSTVASLLHVPPNTWCLYKVTILYLLTDILSCTIKHTINILYCIGAKCYISPTNPNSELGFHCARTTKYKQSVNYVTNKAAHNVTSRGT